MVIMVKSTTGCGKMKRIRNLKANRHEKTTIRGYGTHYVNCEDLTFENRNRKVKLC
jgi:hypothetical protein